MVNKKKNPEKVLLSEIKGLTLGGVGLGVGSQVINKLPATGATAGINKGMTTFGNFFPTFANISSGGYIIKKLKNLKGGKE